MSPAACWRGVPLDSPQSVMEDGNDHYDAGTDVFALIFEGSAYDNAEAMQGALWARWRDFILGSCDTPAWVRSMRDRLALVGDRWDAVISKAAATELESITDRDYKRTIQRTAIDGTDGDVSTESYTGSNVHEMEHESLPQTGPGGEHYYDAKQRDTDTPGAIRTSKYAPSTQDTETYEADDTIPALTFSEMMRAFPDVLYRFADEFDDFFVEQWYR